MKKVIVAMSGGVDSSVTLYKMIENGYEVSGLTLSMGRECDKIAIQDAKQVSEKLGIKHYVLDVCNDFNKNVLDYFTSSYMLGETPNPCVMCNKFVKFKSIIDFAKQNNYDFIATGHYAKIINNNGIFELYRGKNLKKDQSYFLAMLDYGFLQCIKFPLCDVKNKDETRSIAKKIGLHVAEKKDSQDICFINKDYKDFLINNRKIKTKKGLIKHLDGTVLGEHDGIINYTIGQRKGLGISYQKPLYVVKLDGLNNIVYVGDDSNLLQNSLIIKDLNILNNVIYNENVEFDFKLRSTHSGEKGKIKLLDNNKAEIRLNTNTRAITKGQLCAVYLKDMVVGGGWID